MLPKFMSSFMVESQEGNNNNNNNKRQNKRGKHVMSSIESITNNNNLDVGLRLLTQITSTNCKLNNVLVKSDLRRAIINQIQTNPEEFCFLKNCNLCNKQLKPDKDIYMYRGDQGFCSIECRNRQIVLDEMSELESSTKQMVKSYNRQQCCNDARLETRLILEDLRMQRLKSKV